MTTTKLQLVLALATATGLITGSTPSAAGDPVAGSRMAIFCAYCHGLDGNPLDDDAPSLAGQRAESLVARMNDPALYQRHGHVMLQAMMSANCMTERDIENLAAYYAAQPVRNLAARGKR